MDRLMEKRSRSRTHSGSAANNHFAAACFHSPSMKLVQTSLKVKRSDCGTVPFRAESSFAGKAYSAENLSPFTSVQGRLTAAKTSDRRKSRYNKKNSIQTVGKYRSVCCSRFSIGVYRGGVFWRKKRQAANCAPSKNQSFFFDHLPISALLVRLNCFCLHSLFLYKKFWDIRYHKWFDNIHLAGVLLISAALWFHFCITCHCHYCKWHPKENSSASLISLILIILSSSVG